jgi:hypothetical protein
MIWEGNVARMGKMKTEYKVMVGMDTWIPGLLSLGVKRPEREADHSPPSSAEVKNAWIYTSTPLTRLRGVVLS